MPLAQLLLCLGVGASAAFLSRRVQRPEAYSAASSPLPDDGSDELPTNLLMTERNITPGVHGPLEPVARGNSTELRQDVAGLKRGIAICTMATIGNLYELEKLLRSLELFAPNIPAVYAITDRATAQELGKRFLREPPVIAFPELDSFSLVDRHRMTTRTWREFNMKKASILERALIRGHEGALFMDADTFLLAPLPKLGPEALGLSPHHIIPQKLEEFGEFNGGFVFVRDTKVLKSWQELAPVARGTCCQDQTALDGLARKFKHFAFPSGVNVGWYQMVSRLSGSQQDLFDQIKCQNGQIVFKDRPVVSFHGHIFPNPTAANPQHAFQKEELHDFSKHVQKALEDCRHPMAAEFGH